jgi:hypothetical protein
MARVAAAAICIVPELVEAHPASLHIGTPPTKPPSVAWSPYPRPSGYSSDKIE